MKPLVRSALLCLALALALPFSALAADAENLEAAPAVVAQDDAGMTPVAATPADPTVEQPSAWLEPPAWTQHLDEPSFGSCPGPPVLSCQCGPGLGEPGSDACCYCNTCWRGYILELCDIEW